MKLLPVLKQIMISDSPEYSPVSDLGPAPIPTVPSRSVSHSIEPRVRKTFFVGFPPQVNQGKCPIDRHVFKIIIECLDKFLEEESDPRVFKAQIVMLQCLLKNSGANYEPWHV